ncbi:MAG: hypothetical protein MUP90_17940 [Gammaproteobacteria bacterium]|nr:hypothetical protein [Gammaproteobacteria bacterium]
MDLESTGLLGPSVEALTSEQEANFQDARFRLEALGGLSYDPQVQQDLAGLCRLLNRRSTLSKDAGGESNRTIFCRQAKQ